MAGELTIPILPCRSLDDVLPFYEALGFETTFRQARPNPYAVVRREALVLHFAGIEGFDPERSYGSAIVVVPDAAALYMAFAAGLRAAYGKLPATGIPRILRPRKKLGTIGGFTVVDPGGNWIRVYRAGETEAGQEKVTGLTLAVQSAARQGDAKGDHEIAIRKLDSALARHSSAPPAERVPALVYRAELAVRTGDDGRARLALAEIAALDLDESVRSTLADDLATAAEIEAELAPQSAPAANVSQRRGSPAP
jgi:hypothetical protein